MKRILATIFLVFVIAFLNCADISAQQAASMRAKVEKLATEMEQQKEFIQQLQSENHELVKQVESLSNVKEELLRDNNRLRDDMSHWLTVMGWIFTLAGVAFGVVVPLLTKKDIKDSFNEKFKEVRERVDLAADAADRIEGVKKDLQAISEDINKKLIEVSNKADYAFETANSLTETVNLNKEDAPGESDEKDSEGDDNEVFKEALQEKDPYKRILLYSDYIERVPASYKAYNNRGLEKSNLGDKAGAISDYNKAIALNSDYPAAYNNRGAEYYKIGDIRNAFSDYSKAIELEPNASEVYFNRGLLKHTIGNMNGAKTDYNKALELKPNSSLVYNALGKLEFDMENYEESIHYYDKALGIDPNYSEVYNNRANSYLRLRNYDKAMKEYNQAIALNQKNSLFYKNRAILYRILAAEEIEENKKKEYIDKAESDEEMVDNLKLL